MEFHLYWVRYLFGMKIEIPSFRNVFKCRHELDKNYCRLEKRKSIT
jgi:hypothetical protein